LSYSSGESSSEYDETVAEFTPDEQIPPYGQPVALAISGIEDNLAPRYRDLLCSTFNYPLNSTMKSLPQESQDLADLTLMVDEEDILAREDRAPWDERKPLRRQQGMGCLPRVD
jgi:hypothetical protein